MNKQVTIFSLSFAILLTTGCSDFDIPREAKSSSSTNPSISSNSKSSGRIIVNAGEDDGSITINPEESTDTDTGAGTNGAGTGTDTGNSTGTGTGTGTGSSAGTGTNTGTGSTAGSCGNAFETEVLALCNQERAAQGLSPLLCDMKSVAVAHDYSQVMCDQNWFDHYGPDGSSPFERMSAGGISYSSAGENIAAGQATPAAVVKAWMNSSGHRANILGNFKYLGVGYVACSSGSMSHYWTQDFWK